MPVYVTREHYFEAAIEILSSHGTHRLTMTALHRHLGVTSGSFYNYFRNWKDFVRAFLEHWTSTTERIAREADGATDPLVRLQMLREMSRTVPHDAEAAIRIWSRTDDAVRKVQEDVDARRHGLIRMAVVEVTGRVTDADRFATAGLSLIIGLQQSRHPVDLDELDQVLALFIDMVVGSTAPAPGRSSARG